MANPQKEDGYTPIAHKILEQLSKQVISPDEWRILMVIFRKTYGWDKKIDRISHTQFSEITGISRNHIPRIINKLLTRNIIYRVSPIQGTGVPQIRDSNIISYGFQKNYDDWVRCPLNRGVSPKQDLGVPHSGLKVSPKQGHTKDIITKETIQKKKPCTQFDIFYNAFPKHKSRGQAEKVWNKINPDQPLLQKMLDTISKFKNSEDWIKDGGKYIPHPATWLNAKGWEDETEIQKSTKPIEPVKYLDRDGTVGEWGKK